MIRTHARSYANVDLAARFGFCGNRLNQALPLLLLVLLGHAARADVIYLRNGKKLSVERAWEDGNRIRYERNGNVFGFSKELVERIESGPYRPEPRDAVSPDAVQRQQSVPVEVLDEALSLGDATEIQSDPRWTTRSDPVDRD